MKKLLIFYSHPSHDGCHGYLLKGVRERLDSAGAAYELIDLYAINYDPLLKNAELYSAGRYEVSAQNREFQDKIQTADRLLFIYPTWWGNLPAMMKGFFERVFISRFAFRYKFNVPFGLLKGKKAAVFSATGGPALYNNLILLRQPVRLVTWDILALCGIRSQGFLLSSARRLDDRNKKRLDRVAARIVRYLMR